MDCSLPGSSVHGISQARVLEWGAIAFSHNILNSLFKGLSKMNARTSLVVQWLKICLPMQGTWVWPWTGKFQHAPVQLGPWTTTAEPGLYSQSARLEPMLHDKRSHCNRSQMTTLEISPRKKWQPTPVFLPRESQGRGSLVGCRLWGCTESDTTEAT